MLCNVVSSTDGLHELFYCSLYQLKIFQINATESEKAIDSLKCYSLVATLLERASVKT